jgi:prolyl-tRNA editing enzyme YbaK/EbsC (Cys-tRNA(Pro) deacylase)
MTLNERLNRLLAEEYADYQVLPPEETTPNALAPARPAEPLADVTIVRDDAGELAMVVLPAGERLHAGALAMATGRPGLRPATAEECAAHLDGSTRETVPPFGRLYGMTTYLDACLRSQPWIAFRAGSSGERVRMRFDDYRAVAKAVCGQWCFHPLRKAA